MWVDVERAWRVTISTLLPHVEIVKLFAITRQFLPVAAEIWTVHLSSPFPVEPNVYSGSMNGLETQMKMCWLSLAPVGDKSPTTVGLVDRARGERPEEDDDVEEVVVEEHKKEEEVMVLLVLENKHQIKINCVCKVVESLKVSHTSSSSSSVLRMCFGKMLGHWKHFMFLFLWWNVTVAHWQEVEG